MWAEILRLHLHWPMELHLRSGTRMQASNMKVGSMQQLVKQIPMDIAKTTPKRIKKAHRQGTKKRSTQ